MNRYLPYLFGLIVVVPLGALIAQYATGWVAGFRPRYAKMLISTIVAYTVVNVAGLVLYCLGALENSSRGFQVLAGLAALTCAHVNLVRSDAGQSLSAGKAVAVAFCQIFGVVIAVLAILWVAVLIKRLFL
jgi:hypothetical protein